MMFRECVISNRIIGQHDRIGHLRNIYPAFMVDYPTSQVRSVQYKLVDVNVYCLIIVSLVTYHLSFTILSLLKYYVWYRRPSTVNVNQLHLCPYT